MRGIHADSAFVGIHEIQGSNVWHSETREHVILKVLTSDVIDAGIWYPALPRATKDKVQRIIPKLVAHTRKEVKDHELRDDLIQKDCKAWGDQQRNPYSTRRICPVDEDDSHKEGGQG